MNLSPGFHLILGGARSGKSGYAEQLALKLPPPRIYIATARILDEEMAERVRIHRERRGSFWETREAPVNLLDQIRRSIESASVVLIDCITLWLTNILLSEGLDPKREVEKLCSFMKLQCNTPVIVVSNEVGMGIVPENALARRFRDLAGWTNQQLAALSKTVTWMVAGLPVVIKNENQ